MSNIADNVNTFLAPIVEKLGYEIVDVEYKRLPSGMNLTVFIDSTNGITLDDCEIVHKAIDEPLDELDPTNGQSYTLNVSSPGLDRPFKTNRDFDRHIGKEVEVNLYTKVDGKKTYVGILKAYNDESVIIEIKNKNIELNRKNISKITKFISF